MFNSSKFVLLSVKVLCTLHDIFQSRNATTFVLVWYFSQVKWNYLSVAVI